MPTTSMKVVAATKRDLAEIAERAPAVAESAVAAATLVLARQLDNPKTSATAKALCTKQLRESMVQLRELAPPAPAKDGVHDLAAARSARRSRSAAT